MPEFGPNLPLTPSGTQQNITALLCATAMEMALRLTTDKAVRNKESRFLHSALKCSMSLIIKYYNKMEIRQTNSIGPLRPGRNQCPKVLHVFSLCPKWETSDSLHFFFFFNSEMKGYLQNEVTCSGSSSYSITIPTIVFSHLLAQCCPQTACCPKGSKTRVLSSRQFRIP